MTEYKVIHTDRYSVKDTDALSHNQVTVRNFGYPEIGPDMQEAVKRAYELREPKREAYAKSCEAKGIKPLPEKIYALKEEEVREGHIDLTFGASDYAWVDAFMFAPVRNDEKYKLIQTPDGKTRWPTMRERALASGLYTTVRTQNEKGERIVLLGLRGDKVSSLKDSYGTFGSAHYNYGDTWLLSPSNIFVQAQSAALQDMTLSPFQPVKKFVMCGVSKTSPGIYHYQLDTNGKSIGPSNNPEDPSAEAFGDRMLHFEMHLEVPAEKFLLEQKPRILEAGKYKDVIALNFDREEELGDLLDDSHHRIPSTLEGQLMLLGNYFYGSDWTKSRRWVSE